MEPSSVTHAYSFGHVEMCLDVQSVPSHLLDELDESPWLHVATSDKDSVSDLDHAPGVVLKPNSSEDVDGALCQLVPLDSAELKDVVHTGILHEVDGSGEFDSCLDSRDTFLVPPLAQLLASHLLFLAKVREDFGHASK